ncbi:hypothetical protein [Trueperella bialowiezensis]|uniref:hypothetical protein n=1 Tax=Trueperella bialowiezensis TaxID=312285 RepID=UPI000F84AAA3|nr:hypothetical protein [Trueperella bialowiezensis]
MLTPQPEAGFGTVSIALTMLATALVMVGMLQLFYTAWERVEVRNDADLAAISAAIVLRDTGVADKACARARDIAAPSEITCSADGEIVTINASRKARFTWITAEHSARAVAGPASIAPVANKPAK